MWYVALPRVVLWRMQPCVPQALAFVVLADFAVWCAALAATRRIVTSARCGPGVPRHPSQLTSRHASVCLDFDMCDARVSAPAACVCMLCVRRCATRTLARGHGRPRCNAGPSPLPLQRRSPPPPLRLSAPIFRAHWEIVASPTTPPAGARGEVVSGDRRLRRRAVCDGAARWWKMRSIQVDHFMDNAEGCAARAHAGTEDEIPDVLAGKVYSSIVYE